MKRRTLLKLLSLGVIGQELDLDRLLWVPGEKTIFIPTPLDYPKAMSLAQIVDLEYRRILPELRSLFERDDTFYQMIRRQDD